MWRGRPGHSPCAPTLQEPPCTKKGDLATTNIPARKTLWNREDAKEDCQLHFKSWSTSVKDTQKEEDHPGLVSPLGFF